MLVRNFPFQADSKFLCKIDNDIQHNNAFYLAYMFTEHRLKKQNQDLIASQSKSAKKPTLILISK